MLAKMVMSVKAKRNMKIVNMMNQLEAMVVMVVVVKQNAGGMARRKRKATWTKCHG